MEVAGAFSIFHLQYGICVIIFFFSIRFFLKYALRWRELNAVTTIALIHHMSVVLYSLFWNSSFFWILHDGVMLNTVDCGPLSHSNQEIYFSGIFGIVYLAMDSYYAILAPAFRGEKKVDWLLLFHHFNGVVLIYCALHSNHGLYMVSEQFFFVDFFFIFIYIDRSTSPTLWRCRLCSSV